MNNINFSCAKRAADPSNEFAACPQWCGDSKKCLHASAEKTKAVDLLTNTIRTLLNSPDIEVQRLAESLQSTRSDFESGALTAANQQQQEPVYQVASVAQAGAWLDCNQDQFINHAKAGKRTRVFHGQPQPAQDAALSS